MAATAAEREKVQPCTDLHTQLRAQAERLDEGAQQAVLEDRASAEARLHVVIDEESAKRSKVIAHNRAASHAMREEEAQVAQHRQNLVSELPKQEQAHDAYIRTAYSEALT